MDKSGSNPLTAEILMDIGELKATQKRQEEDIRSLNLKIEHMSAHMATKEQLSKIDDTLDSFREWMNKGQGALWILTVLAVGASWVISKWDSFKGAITSMFH